MTSWDDPLEYMDTNMTESVDSDSEDDEIPDLAIPALPDNDDVVPVFLDMSKSLGPFVFEKSTTINIKPDPSDEEFFNLIHSYPATYMRFIILTPIVTQSSYNNISYGEGADRQIYQHVMDSMINKIFTIKEGYFLDICTDNSNFWNYEDNLELFVTLVGMFVSSQCVLPYHFHPILLQKMASEPMSIESQMHFLKYYSPDAYVEINKYKSDKNFDVADITGQDTLAEYIEKDIFIGLTADWKINIYEKIAREFVKQFGSISTYDPVELDRIISGYYELKPSDIISITKLDNITYQNMWTNFIKSLTETELRKLLLLFGNSLSLESNFQINIQSDFLVDIKIQTCFHTIIINEKLFETQESLNSLKIYFGDVDQTIVDIFRSGPTQIGQTGSNDNTILGILNMYGSNEQHVRRTYAYTLGEPPRIQQIIGRGIREPNPPEQRIGSARRYSNESSDAINRGVRITPFQSRFNSYRGINISAMPYATPMLPNNNINTPLGRINRYGRIGSMERNAPISEYDYIGDIFRSDRPIHEYYRRATDMALRRIRGIDIRLRLNPRTHNMSYLLFHPSFRNFNSDNRIRLILAIGNYNNSNTMPYNQILCLEDSEK